MMKLLPLLVLVLAATADAAEKEIRLRDIKPDSPRLKEVVERIEMEARMRSKSVTITEELGENLYLAKAATVILSASGEARDATEIFSVEMPAGPRLPAGHRGDYWLVDTGKFDEHTSAFGQKMRLKRFRTIKAPKGDVIERAKAGEVFRFKQGGTTERCNACGGIGTVRPEKAGANRADCKACEKGFAKVEQVWVVKW